MTDLRQRFLKEFGDGKWHEREDIEILCSLDPMKPVDPDTLLQAVERGGIVVERGDVTIDLGGNDKISGEWHEDLVSTPGFRVVIEK
jgi:hypothetical protein